MYSKPNKPHFVLLMAEGSRLLQFAINATQYLNSYTFFSAEKMTDCINIEPIL